MKKRISILGKDANTLIRSTSQKAVAEEEEDVAVDVNGDSGGGGITSDKNNMSRIERECECESMC